MTKAMPQAIRQYSIAVAPRSSRRNFAKSRTGLLPTLYHPAQR
jgi:hypothetical protein